MTVSDYKLVVGDLALPATSLSLYHLGSNFKLFGVIHTLPKRSSTYERRHSGSVNSFISMVAQSMFTMTFARAPTISRPSNEVISNQMTLFS